MSLPDPDTLAAQARVFDILQRPSEATLPDWTACPASWMEGGPGDGEGPDLDPPAHPGGRYQNLSFLGAGGHARVYRAFDTQLARWVALKFLRQPQADSARRLLAEARAQAQAEHPGICRVYDVGDWQGVPFIAMQLIPGLTLAQALPDLNLLQKVALIRDVAEAVHAAHRLGMVHLDLKPGNILLEPGKAGGGWSPSLTDFGLVVQEGDVQGLVPLGTPPYASPEQMAGDPRDVDRRSDVYSLGMTLYVLLSGGAYPYASRTLAGLLVEVRQSQPLPLRRLAPGVPRDLETIVHKCLAKDRVDRYPSALALAEDLQRFLDREPVVARRPTVAYRLLTAIRRHRALAAAAGLCVLLAAGGSAWTAHRVAWARRQGAIAHHFERELQTIEAMLRQDAMLPIHDVRPVRQAFRTHLQGIQASMALLGSAAEGPGHYVLGRGLVLLGDRKGGLEHLERAWALGFRTPESQSALGEARLNHYFIAMTAVRAWPDREAAARREAELKVELRDGGLRMLAEAKDASYEPFRISVEGRLALYEHRHTEALALGRRLRQQAPWLPEGWVLEGRAISGLGDEAEAAGHLEEAESLATEAVQVHADAEDRTPSAPGVHRLASDTWRQLAQVLIRRGKDPEPAFAGAQSALDRCLQADPTHVYFLGRRLGLQLERVGYLKSRGRPFQKDLEEASRLLDSGLPLDEETDPREVWSQRIQALR